MDKLSKLRQLMEPTAEDDSVLLSYLDDAADLILGRMYPYATDEEYEGMSVPARFESRQVKIAAFLLNKRGAEGQSLHNENGISRRYRNSDIPEELLVDVLPCVGIPR